MRVDACVFKRACARARGHRRGQGYLVAASRGLDEYRLAVVPFDHRRKPEVFDVEHVANRLHASQSLHEEAMCRVQRNTHTHSHTHTNRNRDNSGDT